jgi:hypothetical protein
MTRLEALCKAFGWQGGTIHDLTRETGVSVDDLLHGVPSSTYLNSDYCHGWFAGRTCSVDFNKNTNFPRFYGNKDFWIGVAQGIIKAALGY